MSEKLKIGSIIKEPQKRDAIHIAVVPIFTKHHLEPGQKVEVKDGLAIPSAKGCGVVDPFLDCPVIPGDEFWMFLNPGSITSLRHDWTHPDVPVETALATLGEHVNQESIRRLHVIAKGLDIGYQELLDGAESYVQHGDYMSDGGKFEGCGLPKDFWLHYQIVTKTTVEEKKQGHFFTCSC